MRKLRNNLIVSALGLLCLGLLPASSWAQPVNDSFYTPTLLTGASGSLLANNIGATMEPGESPILGVGGASVWFMWTAPATGQATFSTEGSSFDTLLGVYTGLTVDTLTPLGQNDDVIAGVDLTSSVTIQVVRGTTYFIAVEGYGGSQGNIQLNWVGPNPKLAGGDFHFTSPAYVDGNYLVHEGTTDYEARFGITRSGASSGKVLVTYALTNGFYTNTGVVYTWGTNISVMVTNINPLTAGLVNYTNYYITNSLFIGTMQDCQFGVFIDVTAGIWTSNTVVYEDDNFPGVPGLMYASSDTGAGAGPRPPVITPITRTNMVTDPGNPDVVTIYTTNVFYLGGIATNAITPAAVPGTDYLPVVGTVVFEDYQMYADITTNIYYDCYSFESATTTTTSTNPLPAPNYVLQLQILNVAFDPLESASLSPPTMISPMTNAIINVMDYSYLPGSNTVMTTTDQNIYTFRVLLLHHGSGSYVRWFSYHSPEPIRPGLDPLHN